MVKNNLSRGRVLVVAGIAAVGILIGAVYLKTIPANFMRYLIWRLTSTAGITKGQVRVGDTNIHFVSYGSGPPVLLLHGGLSNRLSWFSQLHRLVDSGRRVVLPDTRGHGDSTLGGAELSYRLLAADAATVLDRLSIEKTDVVRWSDGGNTAFQVKAPLLIWMIGYLTAALSKCVVYCLLGLSGQGFPDSVP